MAAQSTKQSHCDTYSELERLFLLELVKEYRLIEYWGQELRQREARKKEETLARISKKVLVQCGSFNWRRIKVKTKKRARSPQAMKINGLTKKSSITLSDFQNRGSSIIEGSLEQLNNLFDDDSVLSSKSRKKRKQELLTFQEIQERGFKMGWRIRKRQWRTGTAQRDHLVWLKKKEGQRWKNRPFYNLL